MHTSFEDLRVKLYNDQMNVPQEGKIYRMGEDGKPMWERPRTPREAGTSRILTALVVAAIAMTVPLAVVLGILLARM